MEIAVAGLKQNTHMKRHQIGLFGFIYRSLTISLLIPVPTLLHIGLLIIQALTS